jgi:hypothetical protein
MIGIERFTSHEVHDELFSQRTRLGRLGFQRRGAARPVVGPRRHDPMMKKILGATVVAALAVVMAGAAHADPAPPPSPYQIQTPAGRVYEGMRTLPPICATQPRACAGNWSPDTGTWVFPPGT